jgi:hypothetical protein
MPIDTSHGPVDATDHGVRSPSPRQVWRWVATLQSVYFLTTGLWPIIDIESFQAVTGPKTDLWLVCTFGALICVPGVAVGLAAWNARLDRTVLVIGLGSAIVLALCDVIYVIKGSIGPVYLIDAAAELALVLAWVVCLTRGQSGAHRFAYD